MDMHLYVLKASAGCWMQELEVEKQTYDFLFGTKSSQGLIKCRSETTSPKYMGVVVAVMKASFCKFVNSIRNRPCSTVESSAASMG